MKALLYCLCLTILSCRSTKKNTNELSSCINNKIETFKKNSLQNPPGTITEYTYNGSKVYYIPGPCCDQYSEVFDSKCNLLGHPDGGFTGKGDGSLPDFMKEATDAKVVWKDERSK
jgi:hypothetical protein